MNTEDGDPVPLEEEAPPSTAGASPPPPAEEAPPPPGDEPPAPLGHAASRPLGEEQLGVFPEGSVSPSMEGISSPASKDPNHIPSDERIILPEDDEPDPNRTRPRLTPRQAQSVISEVFSQSSRRSSKYRRSMSGIPNQIFETHPADLLCGRSTRKSIYISFRSSSWYPIPSLRLCHSEDIYFWHYEAGEDSQKQSQD